jgi:hypothetical protein
MFSTSEYYAYNGGDHCPVCGSEMIEGGSVDIIYGGAFQEVWCQDCPTSWQSVYNLIGYVSLTTED